MQAHMFDWDDLKVFLAVARSRRIAPAARMLAVEATTVSRRLERLQKSLGAELFEGIGNDRRLTLAGENLLQHAERVERSALAALADMTGEASSASGHVRLSVAEGFATWVLAPAMAAFRAAYPHIRLDLITASGFLNPSKREADMALMLARPTRGRLNVRRLGNYILHLYASKTYLKMGGVPRTAADLRNHVLVGYVPEFIYSPELNFLDEVEPRLDAHLRSTSINVQYRIISGGTGIGVLPDFIGTCDDELVRVLDSDIEIVRSFWLVTHSDLQSLARISAVADWLVQRVASL